MTQNETKLPIAACGLYCGSCFRYKKGKCPGCAANENATWCSLRKCCVEHGWKSCAECTLMPLKSCKKFNNFMGKLFGLVFRSDRAGCIARIKEVGYEAYATEMENNNCYNRPAKK